MIRSLDFLPRVCKYPMFLTLCWPKASGRNRVKLLWNALGSEFRSRHLRYEMAYTGKPAAIRGREFRSFDWAAAEALIDRCLASYDAGIP